MLSWIFSTTWSWIFSAASAMSFLLGYLFGSIPFGLLLTKIAGTEDIRGIGSGNIGATNVLRTGRKGLAAATLLCDVLKGTAAVLIAHHFFWPEMGLVSGFGAFVGHLFPIWLKFRGGKGVATYIGLLLGLAWPVAIAFCLIWLAVAWVSRYSSLSALIASAATPGILWWLNDTREGVLFAILTILVFVMHRANIVRLIDGSETRIGSKAVRP
jgi:glycerol-3-phosphate acyltransferase PlsY